MSNIALTINGRKVTASESQTVLAAALAHGIGIPNLCRDPRFAPTGACRLCLVEIEGDPGFQTACTRLVAQGMIVETETEAVRALRKTTIELLLSEHRTACTTCDRNGGCSLQDYAYEYNASETRFPSVALAPGDANYTRGNAAIGYDASKCIRCQRCVRICADLQMAEALTMRGRASEVVVSTAADLLLNDSTCELCGQCVDTCPTGALYARGAVGRGQQKDLHKVRTTCVYCGVGCQVDLNVHRRHGGIVKVTSEPGVGPNDGSLCVKGAFGMDFVSDPRRLTAPLIKRNGDFEEATWEEAIELIASRLNGIRDAHGSNSIAGLSSAKCTNEDNYVFQKFVRACLRTNNVDHCARLCHASTVAGLARAFGSGAMTNSIAELVRAKCIFVIGSNTTEAHPVIGLRIKEAVVGNGAALIVADPRRIDLTHFAGHHLRQQPGTDVALINAMMKVIVDDGLADRVFIEQRTEGYEALLEVLRETDLGEAERITAVPADLIREAARLYARADTASIVYSMGITQHTTGTDNVLALANLAMLTGNVGKLGAGVNPLRGQNNVQGACDLGALPDVYPGYQKVGDPDVRAKFEQAWGRELSPEAGLTVVEMMHAAESGALRALYIMGENPALSDPNLNRTRAALAQLDFLVVQDLFRTETAEYAHVVLPSSCFAEKDGTFTNTERRIRRVRKAVSAPGSARDDWDIVCAVASAMGYPMSYRGAAEIMAEIAALTPVYGGVSYGRLEGEGLQWPCPHGEHPGTAYLHEGQFAKGKGTFHGVRFREAAELPDAEYPFILSTGRQLYQFHTGTLTRKSPVIDQRSPTAYVEVSREDAGELGITDGAAVVVSTRRGEVVTRARLGESVASGCLFMPFHFHEAAANLLTTDALDDIAKIPEYKVCSARIRPAPAP